MALTHPSAEYELTRLRQRLDRERRARKEAEQIAERTTRDLYEKQRDLQLLESVAVASNEAATIDDALQVAVDQVCALTGWPVGHVYMLDRQLEELVPTSIWHLADPQRFETFRGVTEAHRFASGVGLPGRVLEAGRPVWVIDVMVDPNFPRAKAAEDIGVRAAFAFPVLARGDVVAVLEFFSAQAAEPDDVLLSLLAHVGTQIGRVVERKWGEQELERLRHQMEVLLSSAGEGIYGLDREGRTTFVNPAASAMLGWDAEQLIGMPAHDVVHATLGAPPHSAADCPISAAATQGTVRRGDDDVFSKKDGTSFPVEYISMPIREGGELTGAVVTFNDVTERKRIESQLQYLADHDALTGLFNRRRFEEELSRQVAYAARYGTGGAALVLDLDNFKYVNDTLGHQAGDEVIRGVAGLLRERLRETDVLARLGGDEFAILLPHVSAEQAQAAAEDLLELVRRHTVAVGDRPVRTTMSVGVAVLGREHVTGEELLVQADVALYQAKDEGRDRLALYTPESGKRAGLEAGNWTERIRKGLEQDLFVLYCQPILDLSSGNVSQYEFLLRLEGDDGEVVLPGAFLPAAERFGLIQAIDHWVVREAIRVIAEHQRSGQALEVLLEINLSGKSVGDPGLPRLIERELEEKGVDPSCLVFEITETAAIANMEEARKFADRLTGLGCRFALDDFGAGFGSFSYLKYLPLDYLKIDGDFIANLPRSPVDQRMVRAMVEVARGLDMKTIAEFVEDEETLRLLREFGVDYAQGYHIGRPAPLSELDPGAFVTSPASSSSVP